MSASVNKKLDSAKAKLDSAEKEADNGLAKLNNAEKILKQLKVGPELSSEYYSVKEQATENYRAAMEAAVNQQDNTQLLKDAENATNSLIDKRIGRIEIDDLLGNTDYQTIMRFAALVSPDKKALDFLKSNVVFSADEPEVQHMITYLTENDPDISLKNFSEAVSDIEELKEDATKEVVSVKGTIDRLIKTYFNGYGKALAAKEAIASAREKWTEGRNKADEELGKAKQELDSAREKLDNGAKELEEKTQQYEDGLKQFEEGKVKLENGKKEYEEGLAKYTEKKKTFDSGEKEYLEKKKEFDDKIAEAMAKVDERLEGLFAIQNRRANYGFVNIYSNIRTISLGSGAFIILFLVVCAMVTFSTITILVDEQRVLAGSMKSLGFFNGAIRAKYLLYGVSAALIGSVLGFPSAFLVELIFREGVGKMYVYGLTSISYTVLPFIISSLLVVIVVIAAVFISTHGMLKLTAIQLMAGYKKEKTMKKAITSKSNSGIYGRLIGRNMKTEMSRVVITTLIVALSCSLIGVGFCMKNAFAGIVDQEVERVWGYDIKVNFGNDVDAETMEKLERTLESFGVSYAKAAEIGSIYRHQDFQEYTYILVMDQDIVSDYYHVRDWDTGEEMQLRDDGVLIMNRLSETRNLKAGDTYILFDEKLREHEVTIKGVYENYVGRYVIMSREGYDKLFGLSAKNNIFMIRLNDVDRVKLTSTLKKIVPGITVSSEVNLNNRYKELQKAFDAVVVLLTIVAILMSIFILANLTNIFVSRRRKELIIMRVNGFSVKQCIFYLMREALITAILGFIIGVIIGTLLAKMMVMIIEQPDVMLYRGFQPVSWVIAVVMEAVFAFVTDFLAFRKVKNVKVTDINA